jgi:hypothetical protein
VAAAAGEDERDEPCGAEAAPARRKEQPQRLSSPDQDRADPVAARRSFASNIDRIGASSNLASGSRNTTIAGLIKALLKAAAKAIMQRDPDAPQPKTKRRRRGGTESQGPLCVARLPQRIAARGRYAALRAGAANAGYRSINLGMETPAEHSGSFSLSLCNSFGGFEDAASDHGLDVFDVPDTGAAPISLGL